MVNYIRTYNPSPEVVTACKNPLWSDDSFMKPFIDDDPWLMYGKFLFNLYHNKLLRFQMRLKIIVVV